ncbi:isoleucyl-tRNA synthetase [Gammaproteobacteria bacterium]
MRYGLPVHNPVGDNGRFLPETEFFAGESVFQANPHVLEVLGKQLLHVEKIQHSYPHCWRHKTPILFRATPQWFVGMDSTGLRQKALGAIQQVHWRPEWGQARIQGMVENRPDWCISRQRTWGVPLALFVHKTTGALHPCTSELIEQIAKRIEKEGIDAWFDLDPSELLGTEAEDYSQIRDTLDVWFDSGVTHASVLELRSEVPADLYLEGSDQHRGWFQSSLLTSIAIRGGAPYREVLTHGFTVDEKGRKMSKLLGNVIDPQKVVGTLGADVLRLWVASTDYRAEITISDEVLKRTADSYRRIRNTARFLLANLGDFDPNQDLVPVNKMLSLDRWVVDRAFRIQEEVRSAYESYQFHLIYQKVHNFCAIDLGALYLDILKDRQYTLPTENHARRSGQSAVYLVLEALTTWIAPILSFTADEIWEHLPGERPVSVFLSTYPKGLVALGEAERNLWESILRAREGTASDLESLRTSGQIGSSLDAKVVFWCDEKWKEVLDHVGKELKFVLITSQAKVRSAAERPENAIFVEDGLWLVVAPSTDAKCARCWHHSTDIGNHPEHPTICGRCVTNLKMPGEDRQHA